MPQTRAKQDDPTKSPEMTTLTRLRVGHTLLGRPEEHPLTFRHIPGALAAHGCSLTARIRPRFYGLAGTRAGI
jgi:hypothetical protein